MPKLAAGLLTFALTFALGGPRSTVPAAERPTPTPISSQILLTRHEAPEPNRLAPRPAAAMLDLPARSAQPAARSARGAMPSLLTMFSGLCLVLGLFFLVAWLLRKAAPRPMAPLPKEAAESLGRIPLAARHDAYLLRIGNKLVLVSLSPGGAETLTEITEPLEVERIVGLCQQLRPNSSSNAFRQVFQQFARQKAPRGFLGDTGRSNLELADIEEERAARGHG